MVIIEIIVIIGRQNLLYVTTVMNMNENEILFVMYQIVNLLEDFDVYNLILDQENTSICIYIQLL